MIATGQKALYDTFGFLFLGRLFSESEISEITLEAERLWAQDRERPGFVLSDQGSQHTSPFVEMSPKLAAIVGDDRIYWAVDRLIGPRAVWIGSEGNITGYGSARWHPDRKNDNPGDLEYPRLKVMIYLDEVTSKNGALRVISGSHRNPFHDNLYSMLDSKKEPIPEAETPEKMPFGVAGEHMPCHIVESSPGDVLFFNQSLFHAAYQARQGRRYIALKFAGKPKTDGHFSALMKYSRNAFTPHKAFLENENPNIRRMVEGLAEWGGAKREAGQ